MISELGSHFDRHLAKLKNEIGAYPDDDALWRSAPGIINSGGTLALHMVGNLDHWIGANLGETGYIRDREAEFARRGVSRAELIRRVDGTRERVAQVLGGLSPDRLGEVFPGLPERYAGASVGWFLSHLTIHLGYHLGQLNYHRRILAPSDAAP